MHASAESEWGYMLLRLFQSVQSTPVTFKVAKDTALQTPVFQGTWLQV